MNYYLTHHKSMSGKLPLYVWERGIWRIYYELIEVISAKYVSSEQLRSILQKLIS